MTTELNRRDALKLTGAAAGAAALPAIAGASDQLPQLEAELKDFGQKTTLLKEFMDDLDIRVEQATSCPRYELPYPTTHLMFNQKNYDPTFAWPVVFDLMSDIDQATLLLTRDMRRLAGLSRIQLQWDEEKQAVLFGAYCWPVNYARSGVAVVPHEYVNVKTQVWMSADPVYREFQLRHDIHTHWLVGQGKPIIDTSPVFHQAVDCSLDVPVAGLAELLPGYVYFTGWCDVLVPHEFSKRTHEIYEPLRRQNVDYWKAYTGLESYSDTDCQHWMLRNAGKPFKDWTYYGLPIKVVTMSFWEDDQPPRIEASIDLAAATRQMVETFIRIPKVDPRLADFAAVELSLFSTYCDSQLIREMAVDHSLPKHILDPRDG